MQEKQSKIDFSYSGTKLRLAIIGFLFGLALPFISIIFLIYSKGYSFSLNSLLLIHNENLLLFFLDAVPFLIAVTIYFLSDNFIREKIELQKEILDKDNVIRQYSDFTKQIREGTIHVDFDEIDETDPLSASLIRMRKEFVSSKLEEEKQSVIAAGKERITDLIRKHNNLNDLTYDLLVNLIEYSDAVQGSFYIYNDEEQVLEHSSSYAYNRQKFRDQKFKIGEGLIGQAAFEKNYIYRKNLPESYAVLTSGLIGEQKPKSILITPLTGDEKIQGVIEIASVKNEISQQTIAFLNELREIIGQSIFNIKANLATQKLLSESQILTEQLKKNEEELRKNAVKMEQTQDELQKSNRELAQKIAEVEQATKRLNALLENASEAITIYDENSIVKYVSPSVKNILGFDPEEMIGINRFERGDKILQDVFKELLEKPDLVKTFEYQYLSKSKQRLWLETTARNLIDNPAINGIIFNTRDITVRKEADTAKRLSSEMQALSENSPDMILRIGLQGNFYYANPMTKEFIGIDSKEITGNNINTIELDENITGFLKDIIHQASISKKEIQKETTFGTEENSRIVEFNIIPETDPEGNISTFLLIARDITERKEIELEIENQNKNITESINYAQRIQSAIIPDFDLVKRYLPESFIFYRPRDVVSGDLPWFFVNDKEVYIAAIDCTGHGVPGTLLSFIGYFSLNSIVNRNEILTAGQILDELHFRVRKTLKQDSPDSKARDGMDIAICKINHQEGILEFAGAHRPLFLLRDKELLRYRGDRKAVGGKPMGKKREDNFSTHKINIQKKDKIFIFTDGLPDQIGGPDGRKYQAGRLSKEIIEKNNFSMTEYYDFFVDQFQKWKEGYKQIDDILFIGVEM
jgi:PAS domain S-box-containing protein